MKLFRELMDPLKLPLVSGATGIAVEAEHLDALALLERLRASGDSPRRPEKRPRSARTRRPPTTFHRRC